MYLKILIRIIFTLLLFGALIFIPYGSLEYIEAWILFGIFFIYILLSLPWFLRNNPQLIENRMQYTPSEESDRVFTVLATINFMIYFILISFDAGNMKLAPVPDFIKFIGYLGIIGAFCFIFITLRENTYASRIIEVKADHKVISTGPYSLVRHPFYLGVVIFFFFLPLGLNSLLGYFPYITFVLLFAYRITIEEKVLEKELNGYREYKEQVKKRLIPFIW
jgi:protein-S-isoprenylcysteine O-methyltransferase Ste14